jgi:hypothetical protein
MGLGCDSEAGRLPSIHETLGSIPSTSKKKKAKMANFMSILQQLEKTHLKKSQNHHESVSVCGVLEAAVWSTGLDSP